LYDEVLCNALRYEKWDEAADRIEALTAKVKLMDDLDVINGEKIEALIAKLAEAEAKLAKAMELLKEARQDLEWYVTQEWPKDEHPVYERKWERDMELCRRIDATLAEIEGLGVKQTG
jgi:hypothetical protein